MTQEFPAGWTVPEVTLSDSFKPKATVKTHFEWNPLKEVVAFGGIGMPTSPDSVCLNKMALVAHEPLNLDQGMLSFDPDMFDVERGNPLLNDSDMFRFFDSISTSSDDETQGSPVPSTGSADDDASSLTAEEFKPSKKRVKENSSPAFTAPSKKSKGSPRCPRSRMPTSAYRGVSRCTKDGRWQARIRIAKEVVYLGRYPTEEQAARRYDEAARLHHGAAAMLNFVTPEDLELGRKSVFSDASAA